MAADCPDVELLEDFLDGRGSDQLADHVAECSSCAERMESLLERERDRVFAATTKDGLGQYLDESKYADLKKWTRLLAIHSSTVAPAEIPEKIGRYQVRSFLGKGSFGEVYAVYDPLFDIERAVKVLRRGLFDSESSQKQFLAEARHAVKVSHPGLVDVRDVVIDPDESFIVMKLIEGETLEKRLRRGPIEIANTVEIMIKLAQAADHAHEAGLVHRDLKPANILLDQQQNPVIADFGLVIDQKILSDVDRSTSFAGTRPYMSPEQYSGISLAMIDRRSDLWALGVILAEMLHGQRPFPQRDRDALSHAIIAEEPVLPHGKQFAELNGVVKRCLAKKPDDRYTTAAELANDLNGWSRRRSPKWHVRWQYGWRRNLAIGTSLVLLFAMVWAGQLWASQVKIYQTISELESATASEIPRLVTVLASNSVTPETLKARSVSTHAAAKFRVNLAIAACGGDRAELWTRLVDYLQAESTPIDEISASLESLRNKSNCLGLVDVAVKRLNAKRPDDSPLSPETELRLAAVVAGLRPDDPVWPAINPRIAHDLVRVSEPEFDRWLDLFHPVGVDQLSADLTMQMTSPDESREIQLRSARALASIFRDTIGKPVELLLQADWDELEPLVKVLRSNSALARQVLRARYEKLMENTRVLPIDDKADPSEHDVQSARVAVSLWQLGDRDAVCQELRHDPEPTLQTLVIFGLSKQPINAKDVVAELNRVQQGPRDEHSAGLMFGWLQILSLRSTSEIAGAVSIDWLNRLFLTEKDSGVHAMSRLLADRLGFSLTRPNPGQNGDWLVETVGGVNMDFVVIDRPTFRAGILDVRVKAKYNQPWPCHIRHIPRRVAVGTKEITFEEFRQFRGRFDEQVPVSANDAAAANITLQDAYAYCNWCSDKAGLPRCYEVENSSGGLTPRPNHLEFPGYRLPTEGEWECVCRAGTETGRFFGQSFAAENRFNNYGWVKETPDKVVFDGVPTSQDVGQLLPNRWGLFDTYGNVREHCSLSSPVEDPAIEVVDETFEKQDGMLLKNGVPGIMRAVERSPSCMETGIDYAFSHCRTEVFVQDPVCGIRIARTLVESVRD